MNLQNPPKAGGCPEQPPGSSLVQLPTGMYLYQLDSCCNAHKTCEMSEGLNKTPKNKECNFPGAELCVKLVFRGGGGYDLQKRVWSKM